MAHGGYLVEPKPAPDLGIPASNAIVTVRVIDTTSWLKGPMKVFVEPEYEGYPNFDAPSYSFLITNGKRNVLFDLGVRKDFENLPPGTKKRIREFPFELKVDKSVSEILDEHKDETGVSSSEIEHVIFSHTHWDHTGDMGLFPKSTGVVFGPGVRDAFFPGYPTDPESSLYESYFEGRDVREIDFHADGKPFKIGDCLAYDFFSDGSFYLLDLPGHSIGHIGALARVTTSPDTFILTGGDACHHNAEFRASQYLPLPEHIKPSSIPRFRNTGCPGDLVRDLHPDKRADAVFYSPRPGFHHDTDEMEQSVSKIQQLDAAPNIFLTFAHDATLIGEIPFFPSTINDWATKDYDSQLRWKFINDFNTAIESRMGNASTG